MNDKILVLPPDKSGTRTHPWFCETHGGKYWVCRPHGFDGEKQTGIYVARDGVIFCAYDAFAIHAMWENSVHVADYKLHALDWFYAATETPGYFDRKVVGYDPERKYE